MATLGLHLTDAEKDIIANELKAGKPINVIANEHGHSWSAVKRVATRLKREQAERGEFGFDPVIPGFVVTQASAQQGADGETQKTWVKQRPERDDFDLPPGHVIKGVSALLDENDRVVQKWVKTKEGEIDPNAFARNLETAFQNFTVAAKPKPVAQLSYADQLAFFPIADPHVGLHSWARETGADWDLKIARRVFIETAAKVFDRTPATKHAMIVFGGDNLHADNGDNRTPTSGHALDVDGRYPKALITTCEIFVALIDTSLAKHEIVEVITLAGNHDPHAAHAIAFFLHAWYRNEPRVKIDLSPAIIRFRQFGKVMLPMTHGHTIKRTEIAGMAAAREPKMWGETVFRYAHVFHVHHRSQFVSEGAGLITESHQIIPPQDAYHAAGPYTAGRSLKSIIYDREHGEIGRTTVAVTV